jgi:hypothetical protein
MKRGIYNQELRVSGDVNSMMRVDCVLFSLSCLVMVVINRSLRGLTAINHQAHLRKRRQMSMGRWWNDDYQKKTEYFRRKICPSATSSTINFT